MVRFLESTQAGNRENFGNPRNGENDGRQFASGAVTVLLASCQTLLSPRPDALLKNDKERYFLLYLKTGEGHFAPARSIARYFSSIYGNVVEPVLVDGLTDANPLPRSILEKGYRFLQARAQWSYEFLYALNKFPPIGHINTALANFFIKPYLKKRIEEEQPSKIVIFHFFLIAPVFDILKELRYDIPVVTVVTDPFTAHPLWFEHAQQRYIVFSQRLKTYCMETRHIPESRIHVFPFIVDDKFTVPLPSAGIAQLKQRLGLNPLKKCVLIIGGGDGIPNGKLILRELVNASLDVDIAIVCGKNKQLHSDAMELQQRYPLLKVFAFIDFVYELLNAADIVITKCGASTIMEVLLMKKVPVISDYLWEQELGNMEFVRDNDLGVYEHNVGKLPDVVRDLVSDEGQYHWYQQNIEKMDLRSGTSEVAEFLRTMKFDNENP